MTPIQTDSVKLHRDAVVGDEAVRLSQVLALAGSQIIVSPTPPADTTKYWRKTADNELYFYDGADWVSEKIEAMIMSEGGNTPNNTFFKVGDVRTNQSRGFIVQDNIKLFYLDWENDTGNAANVFVYSAAAGALAGPVAQFAIGAGNSGRSTPTVTTYIPVGNFMAFQWQGNTTNNPIFVLRFRKRHV